MFHKIFYLINLLRGIPAYWAVCLSGAKNLIQRETERYTWFLEDEEANSFFTQFFYLMCRYDCYRNHVIFRCAQSSGLWSYVLRLLFPPKKDLEIDGEIGEGLVVYHGHGTVLAAHSVGKNLQIYQGVTVGRNTKPGREINNPIIGNEVTIYTNAVVAGGITIGDNVSIGAGAVVMKDVPANSVVYGNPCVIKPIIETEEKGAE